MSPFWPVLEPKTPQLLFHRYGSPRPLGLSESPLKCKCPWRGWGEPLSSLSPKSSTGINLSDPFPSDTCFHLVGNSLWEWAPGWCGPAQGERRKVVKREVGDVPRKPTRAPQGLASCYFPPAHLYPDPQIPTGQTHGATATSSERSFLLELTLLGLQLTAESPSAPHTPWQSLRAASFVIQSWVMACSVMWPFPGMEKALSKAFSWGVCVGLSSALCDIQTTL